MFDFGVRQTCRHPIDTASHLSVTHCLAFPMLGRMSTPTASQGWEDGVPGGRDNDGWIREAVDDAREWIGRMAPALTTDVDGVLRSMMGLYGAGQPTASAAAAAAQAVAADNEGRGGQMMARLAEARGRHTSAVEAQAGKDGFVGKATASTGDGTVAGRKSLDTQIAEFQARARALSSIGDARFAGPALLDSANTAISNATKQVNNDLDSARRQAAQIVPPQVPQRRVRRMVGRRGRGGGRALRASRGGGRAQRGGRNGLRPIGKPVPSDGTAGGRAVSAASNWLGAPYVWGGGGSGGPTGGGFDCSGLTQYAVAQATNGEVQLPRTTYDQINSGVRVHPSDVRPGDLIFPMSSFSGRGPEHVQLAAGHGMVIEAPTFGQTVTFSQMDSDVVVVRVM
ncbi:C40 family peptidase [Nocardia cyriacigeorgica]|uniref:C40 family peptidase n=1 Tax=Nocardia cyriacigeorgica TaxID=135487 RepID=UPI00211510C8|nr:C40 family peptidase [Nocardia cyriacigeorgica]